MGVINNTKSSVNVFYNPLTKSLRTIDKTNFVEVTSIKGNKEVCRGVIKTDFETSDYLENCKLRCIPPTLAGYLKHINRIN